MLPVSDLQVWRCPEAVCPVPRRGIVLAPGTMLGHGSGDLHHIEVTSISEKKKKNTHAYSGLFLGHQQLVVLLCRMTLKI